MRYPIIFIVVALLCLLAGESFGIWMSQDPSRFLLAPAHAHLNLVGWVTLTLYGLIHHAYPALGGARLAAVQCILAIIAAVTTPFTIVLAITSNDTNILPAILSSLCIVIATLMFAVMFLGKVAMAKTA